jgi:hypothetical protein
MIARERELRKLGEQYGYDVVRTSGGHYRLRSPAGPVVIAAFSPRSGRSLKMVEADLRRAQRREGEGRA